VPCYGFFYVAVVDIILSTLYSGPLIPFAALSIASCTLYLVAAPLAVAVVRRIDKHQQAKYDLILNEPTLI